MDKANPFSIYRCVDCGLYFTGAQVAHDQYRDEDGVLVGNVYECCPRCYCSEFEEMEEVTPMFHRLQAG